MIEIKKISESGVCGTFFMSLGAFDGDCKGGVMLIWGVEVNNLRY